MRPNSTKNLITATIQTIINVFIQPNVYVFIKGGCMFKCESMYVEKNGCAAAMDARWWWWYVRLSVRGRETGKKINYLESNFLQSVEYY